MTLLLGPPSSGKATLLLALAEKLDPDLKVKLISIELKFFIGVSNILLLFKLIRRVSNFENQNLLQLSGNVTYNGHGMNEFVPQRTAAYISQHDHHIGEMTVRETLTFSARCQGVGSRYG